MVEGQGARGSEADASVTIWRRSLLQGIGSEPSEHRTMAVRFVKNRLASRPSRSSFGGASPSLAGMSSSTRARLLEMPSFSANACHAAAGSKHMHAACAPIWTLIGDERKSKGHHTAVCRSGRVFPRHFGKGPARCLSAQETDGPGGAGALSDDGTKLGYLVFGSRWTCRQ
jgi:hypothetical protein